MTRFFAALFAAASLSAVPLSADSGRVEHDRYPDFFSWVDANSCAFPVEVSGSSNIDDLLFFDETGNLVRILSTVNHAEIDYSANGVTLTAKGSGGIEYTFNADGSIGVSTFGINLLMTLPHYGAILLDTGHAEFVFDPHLHELFHAGPASYDDAAFCAALAGG